jgi:arsenical pump membrane protein
MTAATAATCAIAALVAAGIVVRPWNLSEAMWAVAGALLLVVAGLLPWRDALTGVARGSDVYLFLIGMMLLAELARQEGLFDWLAAKAARLARGSATRLFTLIYAVGTVVTVFLSNDATAVVLTPAVAAVVRAAGIKQPLPYLFICAFIANAASFVLPISNPANLVIYGSHMPPLLQWLPHYALASALSIAATYAVLLLTQRRRLGPLRAADIVAGIDLAGAPDRDRNCLDLDRAARRIRFRSAAWSADFYRRRRNHRGGVVALVAWPGRDGEGHQLGRAAAGRRAVRGG